MEHPRDEVFFFEDLTRWAPDLPVVKLGEIYNPYKWPKNTWVTGVGKNPTYRDYNSIYNDRLGGPPCRSVGSKGLGKQMKTAHTHHGSMGLVALY